MSSFNEKITNIYKDLVEKVKGKFEETRDKLRVKPKYVELPDKYYEALSEEEPAKGLTPDTKTMINTLNKLSLKIKASTLIDYSTMINRELNKVYIDLKNIEKRLFKYVDESLDKTLNTINKLKEADEELDKNLKKIFNYWIELDNLRERIMLEIEDFTNTIVKDYRLELENIDFFEEKINSVFDELNKYLEEVKAETRERRKTLLRYLCFAEGLRTRGVKLYLPIYRIVVRDSRGRVYERYKIYGGNLKINDRMIETVKNMLKDVDKDFIDSMKKYIRVNYSGLRRFYLLSVLKNLGGGK